MSINSRNKGKQFELDVAHFWQQYGYPARRGQQYSGANGDADVVGVPYLHIECKADEHLNIHDAMCQSRRDARPGEIPIVQHKKKYRETLITLDQDAFALIFNEYASGRDLSERGSDEDT